MIPFIGTDDLGDYLGETIATDDALATIAVDAACQTVRSYLGNGINAVTGDVITVDGTGRDALVLPFPPVLAVNSVTVGEDIIDPTTYLVGSVGILYRAAPDVWTLGRRNIVIDYDHGYAIDEADVNGQQRVPSDIRIVALAIAARIYRSGAAAAGLGGVTSETIGNYSYTIRDPGATQVASLLMSEKDTLAPYKVLVAP